MFQVPALQYEDSDCILLWPSVPFTHRQQCQKLSLADENCERCEYKFSLSRAQCLSTEHAYIALPQRHSICEQKLLFRLTFFMSAELSTEKLLFSFYKSRKFYCLLDPASTNIAPGL